MRSRRPSPRPRSTGGSAELPFFLDGSAPYTGAITAIGAAERRLRRPHRGQCQPAWPIRRKLVVYQTSPLTPAGDAHAAEFHLRPAQQRHARRSRRQSGIGTAAAPFSGSLPSFMRQVISQQGEAARGRRQPRSRARTSWSTRCSSASTTASSVNIDEEMANLLNLQNAYGANARVLSTVKEMLDTLLRM